MKLPSPDQIVAEVRWRMRTFDPDLSPLACLFWSLETIDVLQRYNLRAIIQAGTASFRFLPDALDDHKPETATHYTYQFDMEQAKRQIAAGRFPRDPLLGRTARLSQPPRADHYRPHN